MTTAGYPTVHTYDSAPPCRLIAEASLDTVLPILDGVRMARIASHRIASHRIASHRIASHRIASHRIARGVEWCCITLVLSACLDPDGAALLDTQGLEVEERSTPADAVEACLAEGAASNCCPVGSRALLGTYHPDALLAPWSHAAICAIGYAGDDTVKSGFGPDVLIGNDGDDALWGGAGHDQLIGGPGNDVLVAGAGDDRGRGDAGDDFLFGGLGEDVIDGGDGDDTIWGGPGDDVLLGGAGADAVAGGPGHDRLVVRAACEIAPGDWLEGGEGYDTLVGPLSPDQLRAIGAHVTGIEDYEQNETLEETASCAKPQTTASVLSNRPGLVCVQLDAPCPLRRFQVFADGAPLLDQFSSREGLGTPDEPGSELASVACFDDMTLTPGTRSFELTGTCLDGQVASATITADVEPASFHVLRAAADQPTFTAGEPLTATVETRGAVRGVTATSPQLASVEVIDAGAGTYRIVAAPPPEMDAADVTFEVLLLGERGQEARLELEMRYLPRGAPEISLLGANFETRVSPAPVTAGVTIAAIRDVPSLGDPPQAEDVSEGVPWGAATDTPTDNLPMLELGHGHLEVDVSAPSLRAARLLVREEGRDGVQWLPIDPAAVTCLARGGCTATVHLPLTSRLPGERQLEVQLVAPTQTSANGGASESGRVVIAGGRSDQVTVRGQVLWSSIAAVAQNRINLQISGFSRGTTTGPATGARVVVDNGCGQSVPGYVDSLGNFTVAFNSRRCSTERLRVSVDTYAVLPGRGRRLGVARWVGPPTTGPIDLRVTPGLWRAFSVTIADGLPLSSAVGPVGRIIPPFTATGDEGDALRILAAAHRVVTGYDDVYATRRINLGQIAFTPGEEWSHGDRTSQLLPAPFPTGSIRIEPAQTVVAEFVTAHELGHVFHLLNLREPNRYPEAYGSFGEPLANVYAASALRAPFVADAQNSFFESLDFNGQFKPKDSDPGTLALAADMHFWDFFNSTLFVADFDAFIASCVIVPRLSKACGSDNDDPPVERDRFACGRGVYDAPRTSSVMNRCENFDAGGNAIPPSGWSTSQVELARRRFANQPAGWVQRFAWDLHDALGPEPGDGLFTAELRNDDPVGSAGDTVVERVEFRGSSDVFFDRVNGGGGDSALNNDRLMDVLTSYLSGIGQTGQAFYRDRGAPLPDVTDLIDGMLCRRWIPDAVALNGLRAIMGYDFLPEASLQLSGCPDVYEPI